MRITFLLPGYPWKPIGGFRVVYEYANHLVRRRHQVTIVHTRQRVRPGAPPADGLFRRARSLAGRLRDTVIRPRPAWQPIDERVRMLYVPVLSPRYIPDGDAVFATAWWTAEYVRDLPPSKGEKLYLIQHYETWDGPAELVDRTWRYPFRKVVISRWLYEKGLELGVPPSSMRHIPNGIDHGRFRVLSPIEPRGKSVAMLYHSARWKGTVEGLHALEMVRERHPELEVRLFGVPKPQALPSWVRYFRDPPQDVLVNGVYNQSAIFLSPSWTEGWSLPPAEAMACGCCVVAADSGGIRDYAESGENVLLVPPRDPEALAQALDRVLSDNELRIRLAVRGTDMIRQFTWERSTEQLEAFLREII